MPTTLNSIVRLKDQIGQLRAIAEQLAENGREIPAVVRNTRRLLASVKMLELNIVDALELEENP